MEPQSLKRGPERVPDERPFDEVAAGLEKAGRVEDLIRLLESRARDVVAPEASSLLTRAAELARTRLKNLERAEELLRRALLLGGDIKVPLAGLRVLYEQKQDLAGLADVLERLGYATGGAEGGLLILKAADVYEQKLGRKDRAVLCCQQASRANPGDPSISKRVRALLMSERRFLPVSESLDRERERPGAQASALGEEYVQLAEALVDDPTEHPLAAKAAHHAKQLLSKDPRVEAVTKTLEKFEHTWRDRVRVLRGQSLEERDRKRAARLSLGVAKLFAWYDGGSVAKVKEALDRCFLLWPAMPDALGFMEKLAEKNEDFPATITAFEKMGSESKDKTAQADLFVRVGSLRITRVQDFAGALAAFERAAAADPSRADASSLAAELLLENGKFAEAVALLEKYLATVKDRPGQIALRLRLADLAASVVKNEDLARTHFEAVLKLDPANAQAGFEVAKRNVQAEVAEGLDVLLDLAVCSRRTLPERVALCEGAAMLLEEKGLHREAFAALARALSLSPADPHLLDAVLQQATLANAPNELARALRRAAQLASEPSALTLWRALASVLQETLARPEEAREAWQEVLRRAPDDAAASASLTLLKKTAQAAPLDPKTELEQEAAKLEQAGGDPAARVEVYRKLLAMDPDDYRSVGRIAAALFQGGAWAEAAQMLEKLETLAPQSESVPAWRYQRALLYTDRLDRKEDAAKLLHSMVEQGDKRPEVVSALEKLSQAGLGSSDISKALSVHYEQSGDLPRQVAALQAQLAQAKDPAEQQGLLARLAQMHETSLADPRGAFELYLRALALDASDAGLRAELIRLARELAAFAEVSRALLDAAMVSKSDPLAVELCLEAAQAAEEGGGVDEAASALDAALQRSPGEVEVFKRLMRILLAAKRFSDADAALRRRLPLVTGPEKAAVLTQLAQVNSELSRPVEAATALQEAIAAGANEAELLPKLGELYERSGKMSEFAATLRRQIELADAGGDRERSSRLSLKRAQVLEASLGNRSEAVKNYSVILEKKPSDPDALSALEHLLMDPTCREDAARALIPAYETTKDHRKLVSALDVVAESTEDSLEKVLALKQAAYVHLQHLRQPELAFAALARALKLAPADASLRTAARKAAEDADAMDSFADVLSELVAEDIGSARVALYRELSDVQEKKLDDKKGAVESLRALLALEPSHLEALRALQRLHRAGEEWAPLSEVVERLAQVTSEVPEKIALWREVAVLHEQRLSDKESAARGWRQISDLDPLNAEAAIALDRLYTELQMPQDLALALELRRTQEGVSPQGRELEFRLAQLKRDKLEDSEGALKLYREVLAQDGGHVGTRDVLEAWAKSEDSLSHQALEILDPVLAQAGEHARRVGLREARMTAALNEEKGRLSREIRVIYEQDLAQPDMAFMAATKAFAAGIDRTSLKVDLERLARETGAYEELADIYEAAASDLTAEDAELIPFLRRAAELREQLGQPDEGVRLWKELLHHEPQDRQALENLGKLYERSKNAKNLSEVYAKQAQLAQDPKQRRALLIKAGDAFETSGDDSSAVDSFRGALAISVATDGLESLDRLYGKARRFDEQADVLVQLATLAAGEPRQAYVTRRAQLLEKEGEPTAAVQAYEQLLQLAPSDAHATQGLERLLGNDTVRLEAARLLEPLYRNVKDQKKLVEVLDIKLGASSASERVALLNEVAILREALGQKPLAFSARLRAFNEGPEVVLAREELERLAAETGSFEELAAAYEDQLERSVSDGLATELWRRLSVLYGDRLNRPELAVKALEELSIREPKNAQVLEVLSRIHRKTSSFKELAGVMRRQVGLEPQVSRQVGLLFELGRLAEDTLADKQLAAQCYGEVLRRKEDDANAIKFLAKVLTESERWPELAGLILREIQLAEAGKRQEEAFDLMVRLGRLKLTRLGDPRGALETFNAVLARKAGHAGAVGALEEMARSDSPLRGEAASALEPVFASGGEHLKLVQMLESRASAETVPQEKTALLRKVAELYAGPMGNPEMAFVAASRALREMPDEEVSLAMVVRLAEPSNSGEELCSLLEEIAPKASDDRSRAALYRALAREQEQQGEKDAAVESWKKVLELGAADSDALETVARLYAETGKSTELLEVLRRQLSMSEESGARAALLLQIGTLQDEALGDSPGALATFRRLLEVKPDDARALERMEALCQKQERWPELADVLAKRLGLQGAKADPELQLRLGMVREVKLLDKPGSLELYREILEVNPRHAGALVRLEAICQKEPQNQGAVETLLHAYRRSGDVKKLAQLVELRVGVSAEVTERKTLLMELAELRQHEDEPELAFLAFFRAFKEDPNDAGLRKRLEQAADAAKTYDELAHAYEEELPRIAENKDAGEVCFKLGQLLDVRIKEQDRAVPFYEKARALDPELNLRALTQLDHLYADLDRPEELASTLEELAKLTRDVPEKVAMLYRLGQVAQERLESPDRAAAAYEEVLALDRTHLASARLLEQLYEAAGRQEKLFVILKHQQGLTQGPERERILGKMARVSAEGMGDVGNSIELYRELLAKNPRNDQAFAALEKSLEQTERYQELRELLQGKLATTLDPRELVRLNDRLGTVIFRSLKLPEEAIAPFRAALDRDARNKGALDSLKEIYEALGKREELVAVLRRLVPLQENAEGVKGLRLRLAEILGDMGRREEALDACRRALEVDPHSIPELERVHQIFMGLRAYGDAVRSLELRVDVFLRLDERDLATKTLFEIAEVWKGPAGKPESAALVLEKVLELDPANRTAYEQALSLYVGHNDWRAYATAVDRYLPNLVTDQEKIAALRDLGKVREQKLGQKDVAFLALCRAFQLDPADDSLREEVERLAGETGSYEELAAVYEQVADEVPRGPLAERLYTVLARVQDQQLDDPGAAESALRKILEFDPTNRAALEALAGMFERRGRVQEFVIALEQKLEASESIEERKAILRQIARVYDESLENPDEAANALLRALSLEADAETLAVLSALYRRQHQWAELASCLVRARDLAGSPQEQSHFQVEIGTVYEREMSDDEAAVDAFNGALEFDATNPDALEALERLYTKLDRPADLLAVYERKLELTEDYRERVNILFRSAAIWEDKYQNPANADACIEGVLSVDPQNMQAIKTLTRLRKEQGRYEELVQVLGRHIQLATDPVEQAELYVEMGEVYRLQLKQVDVAVNSYHAALQVDPTCRSAMHALGEMYERSGNWPFALEMLQHEAQLSGGTQDAVELFHRMGKINEEMLMDLASAKSGFLEALKIDPGYLPSIRALKGIYEQEQDFAQFEEMLLQEARETHEPEAKAKALVDVARYHQDTKEDSDAAMPFYEEAVKLAPTYVEAARPLADLYIAREAWEKGEKMLDLVTRTFRERVSAGGAIGGEDGLDKDLCRQLYRLGYVSEKLGKKDKALASYEEAYQLDVTYLPALEGLGNLLVHAKRYEDALKVYQTILIHHREDLTDLEVVEVYYQLGEVHAFLNQPDRAQNHFEKSLSIDPGHEPALRALVGIADTAGRFDKAAEYRQKLLEILEDDAKFEMAVELGKLAREKLDDAHVAVDAYVTAYRIKPHDLEVMDALYILYRETRQPQKATEVLQKMLEEPALQGDKNRAKRVWFALGEILRDDIKEFDRAVDAFNSALDVDPRFIDAFSAIEGLLGGLQQWKPLEENYARMIQRLPKTEDTHGARMAMWRALGDLYAQVLKDPAGALMSYQVVAAGVPDDAAVQETYAELAAQAPGNEEKAIAAYRRALPNTQNPGKVLSALASLSAKRKDYDGAYLAAMAATTLTGESGPGEKEILSKLTPYAKKKEVAQRSVTDRMWQTQLFHPYVRGPLSELMAILFEQVGHLYSVPIAQYQVNPKRHRIDVASAQEYQIHHFRYVARLLGMESVELYSPFLVATREKMAKRSSEPAPEPMIGIEICHTHPVCLKVGGKYFGEPGQKEVYYLLGRSLALLRPELALSQRLAPERLTAVFEAAISLAGVPFRYTAPKPALEAERALLERSLAEPARMALTRVVQEYVRRARPDDLTRYLEGAELTALRAAFFVAGEMEPTKKMVTGESGAAYRINSRMKTRELMVFATSEELSQLRAAVGTNVEVLIKK